MNLNGIGILDGNGPEYSDPEDDQGSLVEQENEMEGKDISFTGILENVKRDMCDGYCKYPLQEVPEGKTEDWMVEDDDSPCMTCPLNRL